jgi:hypothetical protein
VPYLSLARAVRGQVRQRFQALGAAWSTALAVPLFAVPVHGAHETPSSTCLLLNMWRKHTWHLTDTSISVQSG